MKSSVSLDEGVMTVRLSGEIDHHTARLIREETDRLIQQKRPRELRLDFSSVSFMDSSGLAVVLGAHRRMKELDGALRVCGVPPQPMKVFAAVRLDRLIRFE